ncbi:MAG: glycosyltransferase family 4 protein [Proteobacteria bacterium]|nr:glycosyltransferase family 4 protein [Pseudomonadota bacterium]
MSLRGPSGASIHLRADVRALSSLGYETTVACLKEIDSRGAMKDPLEAEILSFEPLVQKWPRRYRELGEIVDGRRLARRASLERPFDLIYERFSLFCDGGMRLARQGGTRRIVEINAPLALERASLRFHRLAGFLEGQILRSADRVVAVSTWLADWAIFEVGCHSDRVRVVHNGATTQLGARDSTREKYKLKGLVFGFVGSFRPWHGLELIPQILDALPEATALVVGSGPVSPPTHPRLINMGRVEPAEVPDLIAAMDVAIAPYPLESPPWFCPLKIQEYLAQGVPVVATDVGECRHLIGAAGQVLATEDPAAWAMAIDNQAGQSYPPRKRTWTTAMGEALEHS